MSELVDRKMEAMTQELDELQKLKILDTEKIR